MQIYIFSFLFFFFSFFFFLQFLFNYFLLKSKLLRIVTTINSDHLNNVCAILRNIFHPFISPFYAFETPFLLRGYFIVIYPSSHEVFANISLDVTVFSNLIGFMLSSKVKHECGLTRNTLTRLRQTYATA